MAVAECRSDFKLITHTPDLALTSEQWGVCCKDIGENWPRYDGTAPHLDDQGAIRNVIWPSFISLNNILYKQTLAPQAMGIRHGWLTAATQNYKGYVY